MSNLFLKSLNGKGSTIQLCTHLDIASSRPGVARVKLLTLGATSPKPESGGEGGERVCAEQPGMAAEQEWQGEVLNNLARLQGPPWGEVGGTLGEKPRRATRTMLASRMWLMSCSLTTIAIHHSSDKEVMGDHAKKITKR